MSLPTPYYHDEQAGITIYHGDALDILPRLRGHSARLIVTDPPYMIGAVSAGTLTSKAGTWGDMMNSSRWFTSWYQMCRRLLLPSGAMWTFCNWRSLPVVMKAGIDSEWAISSVLVWDKDWIGPGGMVGLRPRYELVALFAMPDFAIQDRGITDIWAHKWSSIKPTGHPAEKPVGLIRKLIETSLQPLGVSGIAIDRPSLIIDPFMGSGTTLCAAASLKLPCIGIETEERYCEIAVQRLQQSVLPLWQEASS